jgi:hypothetical protein
MAVMLSLTPCGELACGRAVGDDESRSFEEAGAGWSGGMGQVIAPTSNSLFQMVKCIRRMLQ